MHTSGASNCWVEFGAPPAKDGGFAVSNPMRGTLESLPTPPARVVAAQQREERRCASPDFQSSRHISTINTSGLRDMSAFIFAPEVEMPQKEQPRAAAYCAFRNQPRKVRTMLLSVLISVVVTTPFALPALLLGSDIHPIWWGVLIVLVGFQCAVLCFNFALSRSKATAVGAWGPDTRYWGLGIYVGGILLSIALFVGISTAMSPHAWRNPQLAWHVLWLFALARLTTLWVVNATQTFVEPFRTFHRAEGTSLLHRLGICVLVTIVYTLCVCAIIGAVFVTTFFTERTDIASQAKSVAIAGIAYPALKQVLKLAIALATKKSQRATIAKHNSDVELSESEDTTQIKQMRLTIIEEIAFGMPGSCAAALLPIASFVSAHFLNFGTEGEYALLYLEIRMRKISPRRLAQLRARPASALKLAAKDEAEKIVAVAAPYIAALAASVVRGFCDDTGLDGALCALAPSPVFGLLVLRSALALAFEVLTDIMKNAVFWHQFEVLPANVQMSHWREDIAASALIVVASFGMVLTGIALAALYGHEVDA